MSATAILVNEELSFIPTDASWLRKICDVDIGHSNWLSKLAHTEHFGYDGCLLTGCLLSIMYLGGLVVGGFSCALSVDKFGWELK